MQSRDTNFLRKPAFAEELGHQLSVGREINPTRLKDTPPDLALARMQLTKSERLSCSNIDKLLGVTCTSSRTKGCDLLRT